jgi:hypothetical protein
MMDDYIEELGMRSASASAQIQSLETRIRRIEAVINLGVIDELAHALVAVGPSWRVKGQCWCSINRDAEKDGHESACILARAAIAKVGKP